MNSVAQHESVFELDGQLRLGRCQEIDGFLLLDQALIRHLHPQRIEEHYCIAGIEWPGLPRGDFISMTESVTVETRSGEIYGFIVR